MSIESIESQWDALLRVALEADRLKGIRTVAITLAMMGMSYVAQRDDIKKLTGSSTYDSVLKLACEIENVHELDERPLSQNLLADVREADLVDNSFWRSEIYYSLLDGNFPDWFSKKIDDLVALTNHDTPRSVSKLVVALCATRSSERIFDPACGTGGMLLAAAEQLIPRFVSGQELNSLALAWGRLRFLVCSPQNNKLTLGDSLANQKGSSDDFDLVITNPPFGQLLDLQNMGHLYNRAVVALSASSHTRISSEAAYVLKVLSSLRESGTGIVVVPNGFLIRGGTDQKVREYLIREDMIEAVVGLPARLFAPMTSIEAAILVLNKNKPSKRKGQILVMDTRDLGHRQGQRLVLDDVAIGKVQHCLVDWTALPKFSNLVDLEGVEQQDFLLSPARYVDRATEIETTDPLERRYKIGELDGQLANLLQEYEELRQQLEGPDR